MRIAILLYRGIYIYVYIVADPFHQLASTNQPRMGSVAALLAPLSAEGSRHTYRRGGRAHAHGGRAAGAAPGLVYTKTHTYTIHMYIYTYTNTYTYVTVCANINREIDGIYSNPECMTFTCV